jgi:polyphosphate glucokinase
MASSRVKIVTPHPASPKRLLQTLVMLVARLPAYDRISVGFPGVVKQGRILTAPNLGTDLWQGFDLASALTERLGKQSRVLNDADVQGLGVIGGRDFECVLTLGTGIGSAFFHHGQLLPHLELGQHPICKKMTYDQYLGQAALVKKGPERWNRRLRKVIEMVHTLTNYDTLYLGGGNATKIDFNLPKNIKIASNDAGLIGGVRLWDPRFDDLTRATPPAKQGGHRRAMA